MRIYKLFKMLINSRLIVLMSEKMDFLYLFLQMKYRNFMIFQLFIYFFYFKKLGINFCLLFFGAIYAFIRL